MEYPLDSLNSPLRLKKGVSRTLMAASILLCALTASTAFALNPIDKVLVQVDDSYILQSELDTATRDAARQIRAQSKEIPPMEDIQQDVLRQLVMRKVQLAQVKRIGAQASPESVNQALQEIAQKQGFATVDQFRQALEQKTPGNFSRLREDVANDLTLNLLRQQKVNSRIHITEQDIDNFLASPESKLLFGPEMEIVHFRVLLPENTPSAQHDSDVKTAQSIALRIGKALDEGKTLDAILAQHSKDSLTVQGGNMGWRKLSEMPTAFQNTISSVEKGHHTDPLVAPDGVHLIWVKDKRTQQQIMVHQYQVRHILIQPNELISEEDAQHTIEQLAQRIKSGESFDTLAKTYSQDPGSARKGGDLGWVSLGEMVPEFDEAMKKTPVGTLSEPIHSMYGWHILQVQGERDQDMTTQYQRTTARKLLHDRQYDQEMDNWLREIRAQTYIKQVSAPEAPGS